MDRRSSPPSGPLARPISIRRRGAPDKDLDPAFPQLRRTVVLSCRHLQTDESRQLLQQSGSLTMK